MKIPWILPKVVKDASLNNFTYCIMTFTMWVIPCQITQFLGGVFAFNEIYSWVILCQLNRALPPFVLDFPFMLTNCAKYV